jgi:hypothetical protein
MRQILLSGSAKVGWLLTPPCGSSAPSEIFLLTGETVLYLLKQNQLAKITHRVILRLRVYFADGFTQNEMSIESIHAYRFGYLKSEAWSNVRLEALARESGRCQICGEENIHNDAHHVWYPEHIYETKAEQLVILCRPCHEFIHEMLDCKTGNQEQGEAHWSKFSTAVQKYRIAKLKLFNALPDGAVIEVAKIVNGPKELRSEYLKCLETIKDLRAQVSLLLEKHELDYSI